MDPKGYNENTLFLASNHFFHELFNILPEHVGLREGTLLKALHLGARDWGVMLNNHEFSVVFHKHGNAQAHSRGNCYSLKGAQAHIHIDSQN